MKRRREVPLSGERRWPGFVVAAMLNPFTVPALGGAILAAVALGVHLGESSIGLINPVYFQGPALHPRERGVAIDESAVRPRAAVAYSQLYGWDEGRTAIAADCGDCPALQARDAHAPREVHGYSAQVPYFGSREDPRTADIRERAELRALEAVAEQMNAEEAPVEKTPALRYAYYPIEEPAEPLEELPVEPDKFYSE